MGPTWALLCMCCSCVAWSSCGTANSESRGCLYCLLLGPFLPGFPHLVLLQLDIPWLADTHGRSAHF
ncbi:hypothetical protein I79_003442 [Cricetulus griseus]|uniref:Secreted protein n=1 Tax=Cricetulus griseus TaxID=10029 RepID=G3GZZ4_CRIGR|nr:hypothetical protein I79_003442 [Cricetulus griseus]